MPISAQIEQHTRVGEIYLASLMRAQLRQALRVLGLVAVTVGVLPLAFAALPGLSERVVLGVPLPWVVLAFAVYPFLFLCGWWFTRRAERNEEAFVALVRPGPTDGPRGAGRDDP